MYYLQMLQMLKTFKTNKDEVGEISCLGWVGRQVFDPIPNHLSIRNDPFNLPQTSETSLLALGGHVTF